MNAGIEIVPFSEEDKEAIKVLNYQWLEKYFHVEKGDELALADPQKYIIDKGGYIFYAKQEGTIIGTASLLKKTTEVFELGKMAVDEAFQGKGVGKLLLEYCIDFAKQLGIKKLILYSNTRLKPAIHMYRTFGFVEIDVESGLYERADIKMEKDL